MRAHEAPHLLTVRSQLFGVLLARRGPTVTAWSSLGFQEFGRGLSLKSCPYRTVAPFFLPAITCGCLGHGVTPVVEARRPFTRAREA